MGANSLLSTARYVAAALVFTVTIAACGVAFAQTQGGGRTPSKPGPAPAQSGEGIYNSQSACAGGPSLPTPSMFGDATNDVKDLSQATQAYIHDCGCTSQACIADALDKYAEALARIAPRLPARLQNAPDIVATAARRVRVARTKKEALSALHDAIAAINKDIELVKAEDPANDPARTRSAGYVVDTLNVASLSLEKGGGL